MNKLLRVTQLETFRRYRDDVIGSSEQQVVDSISGLFLGNDKTNIGSAFHWIVENNSADVATFDKILFDKFGAKLSDEQKHLALSHAKNLGVFTPEIRLNKTFKTDFGAFTLSGQMDALQGNTIRDNKVTFSPVDMQKYADSYQWRLYLSIFELDRFLYDVFEVVDYKEEMGRDITSCKIIQHEPFECLRYENMETDIENLLYSFCRWVDYRDLWGKIKDVE
jgi:hypothetical protein